jgi:molybdopterin converting factor small subunit
MDNSSNNKITVNVRLSSQIADTLGTNRVSVTVDKSSTVSDVKEEIKKKHPDIEDQLDGTLPVISGKMVNSDQQISQGENIAFLSPAAGG